MIHSLDNLELMMNLNIWNKQSILDDEHGKAKTKYGINCRNCYALRHSLVVLKSSPYCVLF